MKTALKIVKTQEDPNAVKTTAGGNRAPVRLHSLIHVLETAAYHAASLMDRPASERPFTTCLAFGELAVHVEIKIEPTTMGNDGAEGSVNVWDQVWVNGQWAGNRCGGRNALMTAYAPVIEAAAKAA